MTFSKVLLFKEIKLEIEEELICKRALELGLPVEFASLKEMQRGKIPLDKNTLVAGSVGFVKAALRILGKDLPAHIPYPKAIEKFLGRKVWFEPKLKNVLSEIENGRTLFVKPARGWKRFTGFVCDNPFDYRFKGSSKNAPVWVSDPVSFVSEWRVYVCNDLWYVSDDLRYVCKEKILGIFPSPTNSKEDESLPDEVEDFPDPFVIADCLKTLFENQKCPKGFAIDFGVISSGETVLVEMNDGFAIGNYGLSDEKYFKMVAERWRELLHS